MTGKKEDEEEIPEENRIYDSPYVKDAELESLNDPPPEVWNPYSSSKKP